MSQEITIRGAIRSVKVRPKKDLRLMVLSCGKSDAGNIARLSLMGAIAFDVGFSIAGAKVAATATLRAEIESIDTRCETSERTLTLSYATSDALKAAELGTYEQIEFMITFTPAAVVQAPKREKKTKEAREV